MPVEERAQESPKTALKTVRYAVVIALLIAFAGFTTFAVMSDISIHGLTVRFYGNVSRYCTMTTQGPVLTFSFSTATVYSSASLTTSVSNVVFAMAADGIQVGTSNAPDAKFDPGHSISYNLTFTNPTLDPHSQPLLSQIVLSINAQASAGLYRAQTSASDSELVHFSGPAC